MRGEQMKLKQKALKQKAGVVLDITVYSVIVLLVGFTAGRMFEGIEKYNLFDVMQSDAMFWVGACISIAWAKSHINRVFNLMKDDNTL
tara:strand:- start:153 stop:416 length:264 start_codon:yes stop_codon:yes gene_type:complete